MQPALEVPEILCLVFKCGISEHDLFNCTRVCRLWSIWAADVLWRTCRVPLQQVLRVLTSETRTGLISNAEINIHEYGPVVNIRSIDENGWRRLLVLSSKISRIKIDCGLTQASLERIDLAKRTFNGECFGLLRTLKMEIIDGDHKAISLVAVPSLTSIYLRCEGWEGDSMVWVNNNLPAAAPNITHFGFRGWHDTKLDVSRYSALKYIEVCTPFIRPHFWESLASCRLLTKVLLKDCRNVAGWGEEWRVEYVYFPALCTFKIRGGHPRVTLSLILRSRMPMLECLRGNQSVQQLMVPHLKAYSPRLDVDALYAYGFTDSDEECW